MSRIGRAPIVVPNGTSVTISENLVSVKGPKGQTSAPLADGITVTQEAGQLVVNRPSDSGRDKALHGLTRALLNNAVVGASEGFTKVLELRGVGYRAEATPKSLNLLLGYSHPVNLEMPEGVTAEVTTSVPTSDNGLLSATITLRSHSKQALGDFAADVKEKRPVEPYKGKGLRYKGEAVRRKLGKQAKGDKKK